MHIVRDAEEDALPLRGAGVSCRWWSATARSP